MCRSSVCAWSFYVVFCHKPMDGKRTPDDPRRGLHSLECSGIKINQPFLALGGTGMKVMAGITIVLAIFGLFSALRGDGDEWNGAVLRLSLLVLSCVGGFFAVLFLIVY